MKRLIALSDAHSYIKNIRDAIRGAALFAPIDAVAFLGDGADDFEFAWRSLAAMFPSVTRVIVRGNCDWRTDAPEEAVFTLGGVRFFACHGHQYSVKLGLERLCYEARDREAAVALYGHTHTPHCSVENGIYAINPGAVCSRAFNTPAYADIRISEDGLVRTELVEWSRVEAILASGEP